MTDAVEHVVDAAHASDPQWFKKRKCRLAPKPSRFELAKPECVGGKHRVRPIVLQHPRIERGKA